jgi:[protein-PII] uridylyltransferase
MTSPASESHSYDVAAPISLGDEAALTERLLTICADKTISKSDATHALATVVKQAFADAREVAQNALTTHATGLQAAQALSSFWDGVLQALMGAAAARIGDQTSSGSGIALAAVGGYGRGRLAPYSDLDLLFIVPGETHPRADQAIQFILYILWDAGIKVGHAVRTQDECIDLAARDMIIRTNMLEARFLVGDESAFNAVMQRYWDEVAVSITNFVDAKLNEREVRHEREGNSRYRV